MPEKDEVQSLNPRYGGATPEEVARALVRPRSWETEEAGEERGRSLPGEVRQPR